MASTPSPSPVFVLRTLLILCAAPLGLAGCSGGGGSSGSIAILTDTDADGLPDRLETDLGTDPQNADSPTPDGDRDVNTPSGPGPDALPDGLEAYIVSIGGVTPITARDDMDGDQIPDYLEVQSGTNPKDRNDPVFEGAQDAANAGGPAFDGVSDGLESYLLRRGAHPPLTALTDTDDDGITDVLEVRTGTDPFDVRDPALAALFDLDRDGVSDVYELIDGSNELDANFPTFDGADDDDGGLLGPDGDGLSDGLEGWIERNGGTTPITTFSDTDGDGAPDLAELNAGRDPFDADDPSAGGLADRDGDGLSDALEALFVQKTGHSLSPTSDVDLDLVADAAELLTGTDPLSAGEPAPLAHFDLDRDGVADILEVEHGSDPRDGDDPLADGGDDLIDASGPPNDPISDALEALLVDLGASAPVTTYLDSDGDGVPDFVELRLVSDPFDSDSPLRSGELDVDNTTGPAGDGLSDAAELVLVRLGALAPVLTSTNSDLDVIPDAIELVTGSHPSDPRSPRANTSPDIDGDGAVDYLELSLGSDPADADDPVPAGELDSDLDGLSDALEASLLAAGAIGPVTPLTDSDGDGLYDYLEVALASAMLDGDSPVVNGGLDVEERTGPAGDGLSDAAEVYLLESGATRPASTRNDSDGDLVPDYIEINLALDAFDATSPLENGTEDDDGDGVSNALEFVLVELGAVPPVDLKTDSDGDGAPDALEIFAGAAPFDEDVPLPGGLEDGDNDRIPDALELVLVTLGADEPVTQQSDTDADGIGDAYEVLSGTNPINRDHPLTNGGADVINGTGPADTITDALEALLIEQGASTPVTRADDSDGDGAPDYMEVVAAGDPFLFTSPVPQGSLDPDADHMSVALELVLVRLGATPPLNLGSDTDSDGAPDFLEVETAAHPLNADVPVANGAGAGFDSNEVTGPGGDGISDALERLLVDVGCPPPIGSTNDTDLDGLPDYYEARRGTNPIDSDSPLAGGGADTDDGTGPPGDGISDALEAYLISQGASGPVTLNSDTDGDGVPDFYEVFKGSDPLDEDDTIAPGTRPTATGVIIIGTPIVGGQLTGAYVYNDLELDPEGETILQWTRDFAPIPGETDSTYLISFDDVNTVLAFEVTPVSSLAFPPNTATGVKVAATLAQPIPDLPRGAGGPGGIPIAANLEAWQRTDEGVITLPNGPVLEVTQWRDSSGHNNHAGPTSVDGPELITGLGPRGASAVRFGGAQSLSVARPGEFAFTIVACVATISEAGDVSWPLSPSIIGNDFPACTKDYMLGINFGIPLFVVQEAEALSTIDLNDGLLHTIEAGRDASNGKSRLFIDGTLDVVKDSPTASSLDCPTNLFIGSATDTTGFFSGDIYELMFFNGIRFLTPTQRALINIYLDGRFETVADDPRYTHTDTHGAEIAGIGRTASNDVQSTAEGIGIVQLSGPSALSDGDFLVWGTDAAPNDFSLSQNVPPTTTNRLTRTWAYTITDGGAGDGVGVVNLRFRVGGLPLSPLAQDFALLLDDDTDFSDADIVVGATLVPNPVAVSFTGVDLSGHSFFALAVRPQ